MIGESAVAQRMAAIVARLRKILDSETGEILCDIDTIYARIDALQMEKKSILEFLAKLVLNTRAEAAAVKTEETRLRERRTRLEKWLKRPNADSAEYKLWGNGVALPCVHFVMCGIAFFDRVKG